MESVAIWQRFSSATFVPSQPHCYISLKPPLLLFHILYISKVSIPFKIKLCTSPMICFDFSRPLGIPYIFSSFVSCSSSSSYGCFFFFFFKKNWWTSSSRVAMRAYDCWGMCGWFKFGMREWERETHTHTHAHWEILHCYIASCNLPVSWAAFFCMIYPC